MKKKFIYSFLLTILISAATSFKTYAAIDTYLLKVDNNVCEYNLEELKDSFMNSKLGKEDSLYKEFQTSLSKGAFYLIHDNEGKYVSYDEIKDVFLEKKVKGEEFNLDNQVKEAGKAETPAQIDSIKSENNKIVRELFVLKNDTKLDGSKISKDKYTKIHIKANNITVSNLEIAGELVIDPGNLGKVRLDNVKCDKINVLSGDKKGISFNKVESKEVKIDEKANIEIQYEDKTPGGSTGGNQSGNGGTSQIDEATKINMLNKAKAQLTKVYSLVNTDKEKEIIAKINDGISSAISDKNYNYASDVEQAKKLYTSLSEVEKKDLQKKLLDNVDLLNIYNLMDLYGISI